MTRKHILPLTYAPKIPKVLSGECTQTIRAGRRIKNFDLISFHGWEGKPYHSNWSFRTSYFEVNVAEPIKIFAGGIWWEWNGAFWDWQSNVMDDLAWYDSIVPSTGEELGNILLAMHDIPDAGLPAQIIRWTFSNETSG